MDVNSHPHLGFIFCSIFDRFPIDFLTHKYDFLLELYRFYSSLGLSGFVKMKWILQCIFEPTWLGLWIQKKQKAKTKNGDFKRHQQKLSILGSILYRCWLFCCKLTWTHVGHLAAQDDPRGLQDASKTPPRRSKTIPKTPQMAQDASKPAPEPSRLRFWCLQA